MDSAPQPLIQLANISKSYPGGVVANDDVSVAIWEQTIHAIIGENGAGKSTLVSILYGRTRPDNGRIRFRGADVKIHSPIDAMRLGIGIVTQHSSMIPALTTLENIILGAEPISGITLDEAAAKAQVNEICSSLGIQLDLDAKAANLSVAALQKAEICKALFRGATVLVLDEPTATLTPQESNSLFELLHKMVASGSTVLLVTHKLREVMEHSDRVSILREGKLAGERITKGTDPNDLLTLMFGGKTSLLGHHKAASMESSELAAAPWQRGPQFGMFEEEVPQSVSGEFGGSSAISPKVPVLELKGITVYKSNRARAINDLTLSVEPGEVVGVAGVDGSGQRELAEAIVGLIHISNGEIRLDGEDISYRSVSARMERGIAYIPEDRTREGLVLDFSISENLLLGRQRQTSYGGGRLLSATVVNARGNEIVRVHHVRAGGGDVIARALSGGNQQKVVLARALESSPRLLVACQPTRGLDIEAASFVYDSLRKARVDGLAILLFTLDMDELLEISDRIAVLHNGSLAAIRRRSETSEEEIGRFMLEGSR